MLIFSFLLFQTSCEKIAINPTDNENIGISNMQLEENTQLSFNRDISLLDKTKPLTNAYLAKLPASTRHSNFWQIVYADAKGFAAGAATGAFLATLTTGIGGGFGALTVGTIMGTLASAAEAEKLNKESGDTDNAFFNPNNPYDNIGISHYNILKNYYNSEQNNTESYGVDLSLLYNESLVYFDNNGYNSDTIELIFPYDIYIASWEDYYNNEYITDIKTVIIDLYEDGEFTHDTKEIFIDYIDAMEASNSYASFANYSINIENAVTNSNYDEMQKLYLLGFMSTSRIGASYWDVFGN